jgi:hypothetical protein
MSANRPLRTVVRNSHHMQDKPEEAVDVVVEAAYAEIEEGTTEVAPPTVKHRNSNQGEHRWHEE